TPRRVCREPVQMSKPAHRRTSRVLHPNTHTFASANQKKLDSAGEEDFVFNLSGLSLLAVLEFQSPWCCRSKEDLTLLEAERAHQRGSRRRKRNFRRWVRSDAVIAFLQPVEAHQRKPVLLDALFPLHAELGNLLGIRGLRRERGRKNEYGRHETQINDTH